MEYVSGKVSLGLVIGHLLYHTSLYFRLVHLTSFLLMKGSGFLVTQTIHGTIEKGFRRTYSRPSLLTLTRGKSMKE